MDYRPIHTIQIMHIQCELIHIDCVQTKCVLSTIHIECTFG